MEGVPHSLVVSSALCEACSTQVCMLDENLSRTFSLWVFLLTNLFSFNLVCQLFRVTQKLQGFRTFFCLWPARYTLTEYFLPLGILSSLGGQGSVFAPCYNRLAQKAASIVVIIYRTGQNNKLGLQDSVLHFSYINLFVWLPLCADLLVFKAMLGRNIFTRSESPPPWLESNDLTFLPVFLCGVCLLTQLQLADLFLTGLLAWIAISG